MAPSSLHFQAWQQRHDALLPLLLNNPPAALLAGPAIMDPVAAAAASGAPLLLVTSPAGAGTGDGSGSIVHTALGMLPGHAPLSAGLLLQAAKLDAQGQQLLQERSAAALHLAAALQQYAAAVACLLGGAHYSNSSQHAHWLAAFQAALELPAPQVGAPLCRHLRWLTAHSLAPHLRLPARRPQPPPLDLSAPASCRASSVLLSWRHAVPTQP